MLKGNNLLGLSQSAKGKEFLSAFSTVSQEDLPEKFTIATDEEVNEAIEKATVAFHIYKNKSGKERAAFLEAVGDEIMALGDDLIERAMLESGLPKPRLVGERGRTVGQLRLFAELLKEGSWVEAVIDPAMPDRMPMPRADIRKMLVPIGPVVVFGASNFPLAFSTAGGDTASAWAGGNPVILKAHQSHLGTNEMIGNAIAKAAEKSNMPDGVFSYLIGKGSDLGIKLVTHEGVKAVGFTGSQNAGMAIYKAAVNDRKEPIPVYAEMSSINPVLLLPGKMKNSDSIIDQVAASVVLGCGQFCTNPGLLFIIDDENARKFIEKLTLKMSASPAATMLNPSISKSYYSGMASQKEQEGVKVLLDGVDHSKEYKASPFLSEVNCQDFVKNPNLQKEIFGPSTLVVVCRDHKELNKALNGLEGQLTGTVMGEHEEFETYKDSISVLESKVGRILFNGVPTGVEVGYAMVHGGPFPATTNANSTSVGTDAIKRFCRPLCFQDCPESLLPPALHDSNPLKIMRRVNGEFTSAAQ
ncbi:MAG: aldehyde dehydrogenase (NADP(+)) [Ginsengibacter sp.]